MHIKFRNKFHNSIPCLSSIESRPSSSVFNLVKCSKFTLSMRKTLLSFMSHSISFLNREQSIKLSLQLGKVFKVYTVNEKNNTVFYIPFHVVHVLFHVVHVLFHVVHVLFHVVHVPFHIVHMDEPGEGKILWEVLSKQFPAACIPLEVGCKTPRHHYFCAVAKLMTKIF